MKNVRIFKGAAEPVSFLFYIIFGEYKNLLSPFDIYERKEHQLGRLIDND